MIVLSHRGYWKTKEERNLPVAFDRSFDLGFGTETDLRDRDGRIVISHDPATADAMDFDTFLGHLRGRVLPLALNIKADGLAPLLERAMRERPELAQSFVFDMSVPDLLQYARRNLRFFTRLSEYEPQPALLDSAAGVWLDAFESTWFSGDDIHALLRRGLQVCVVSAELHGRDAPDMWRHLATDRDLVQHPNLMLCTDLPEEAVEFFGVNP